LNKFPISPIFIPGNKLEWISKTFDKGTDSIILDLEDSVPAAEKFEARENLVNHLSNNAYENLIVRINPINEQTGKDDILALAQYSKSISAFMLPKIEESSSIASLPNINVIALLETPLSIQNISAIAAEEKVKGLALGGADLSASLGSTMDWDALLYSRSKIILEAAMNNLFTIDSPFMNIADLKALEDESIKSKDMGFNGKAAIHPSQIEIIKKSFLPSEDELEEAIDIIKAFKKSSSAVIAFRGRMVDLPIVLSMEKRLRLVGIDPKNID
jgi:citrate lyase beta subunit